MFYAIIDQEVIPCFSSSSKYEISVLLSRDNFERSFLLFCFYSSLYLLTFRRYTLLQIKYGGQRSRFRRNFCTTYVFASFVSKTNFLRIPKDRITKERKRKQFCSSKAVTSSRLMFSAAISKQCSRCVLSYIRVTLIRLLRAMCVYKLYEVLTTLLCPGL